MTGPPRFPAQLEAARCGWTAKIELCPRFSSCIFDWRFRVWTAQSSWIRGLWGCPIVYCRKLIVWAHWCTENRSLLCGESIDPKETSIPICDFTFSLLNCFGFSEFVCLFFRYRRGVSANSQIQTKWCSIDSTPSDLILSKNFRKVWLWKSSNRSLVDRPGFCKYKGRLIEPVSPHT